MVKRQTRVSIEGDAFYINGAPTYAGRYFEGAKIEGLLLNTRMVQGVFDDRNPSTRGRWAYPDTGVWDPERNVREFIEAMPIWAQHGVLSFTINFQGGSPQGYSIHGQPWITGGFDEHGEILPDYLERMQRILDRADELGMVPIVGLLYFGQDEHLKDEAAVKRAVERSVVWLLERGYSNVLLEINNECDLPEYEHPILQPDRVHELIELVKAIEVGGQRLLVGTSFRGGAIPVDSVVRVSDFVLIHGNGVHDHERIGHMVEEVRRLPSYRPMPILFNEDDHFDFDKPENNMMTAISKYASWGYFDPGSSNYVDGYQSPPVNWGINTPRKQAFFAKAAEVAGYA